MSELEFAPILGAARVLEAPYYHGGPKGLERGDLILPPSETGVPIIHTGDGYDPCRIYVTTNALVALLFAAGGYGTDGMVYRVEPCGQVTADELGASTDWSVKAAVVVARVANVTESDVCRAGRCNERRKASRHGASR